MSYRNDHDAALARVDVLQLEVDRLRATSPAPEQHEPRERRGWRFAAPAGLVALFLVGVVGGVAMGDASDDTQRTNDRIAAVDTRLGRAALDACLDAIGRPPAVLGGYLSPSEIAEVEATGAPCRLEIRDFARAGLWSPTELDALHGWAMAEDTLANTIAMVGEYHGSDPQRLDEGLTARQLWSEYQRALTMRDATVAIWRATR